MHPLLHPPYAYINVMMLKQGITINLFMILLTHTCKLYCLNPYLINHSNLIMFVDNNKHRSSTYSSVVTLFQINYLCTGNIDVEKPTLLLGFHETAIMIYFM